MSKDRYRHRCPLCGSENVRVEAVVTIVLKTQETLGEPTVLDHAPACCGDCSHEDTIEKFTEWQPG